MKSEITMLLGKVKELEEENKRLMEKNRILTQEISGLNSRAITRSEEMVVNKTGPHRGEMTDKKFPIPIWNRGRGFRIQLLKVLSTIKLHGVQKFTEADSMTSLNNTLVGKFLKLGAH